jgi:hypothetical protein
MSLRWTATRRERLIEGGRRYHVRSQSLRFFVLRCFRKKSSFFIELVCVESLFIEFVCSEAWVKASGFESLNLLGMPV